MNEEQKQVSNELDETFVSEYFEARSCGDFGFELAEMLPEFEKLVSVTSAIGEALEFRGDSTAGQSFTGAVYLLEDQLKSLGNKLEDLSNHARDTAHSAEAYKWLGHGFVRLAQLWKDADSSYRSHITAYCQRALNDMNIDIKLDDLANELVKLTGIAYTLAVATDFYEITFVHFLHLKI